MSDGTVLNLGSGGDTISTDDIGGGLKVQRVKVQFGADGSAADVVAAAPLPVRLGDGTTQQGVNAATAEALASQKRATTGTASSVAGSASSVQLLAANTSRLGATIRNDSNAILYLHMGTTATSSDVYKMSPDDVWTLDFNYTGRIDGIWATATGNARIVEFT